MEREQVSNKASNRSIPMSFQQLSERNEKPEEKKDRKRKIIRMSFAIDPASDNEVLNSNSGESDVKD